MPATSAPNTPPSAPKVAAEPRQRVLLVTGLLGAGKTTALKMLEDLGWETIDNFPLRLLERQFERSASSGDHRTPLAIGFDSRTRGFDPNQVIERVKRLSARDDIELATLFLDCSGRELERRYNETRRRHPLAPDSPVAQGIATEREQLEPLRRWADMVITTTDFTSNDLQQAMLERFLGDAPKALTLTVISFGFARGTPPNADLVFDMRFLDNPHWIPDLRQQTGLDPPVAAHIAADPAWSEAFRRISELVCYLLPCYQAQGKAYVTIGCGCTGGRHRSVFTADQLGAALRAAGYAPNVIHRNLGARPTDFVEGLHHAAAGR